MLACRCEPASQLLLRREPHKKSAHSHSIGSWPPSPHHHDHAIVRTMALWIDVSHVRGAMADAVP